MFLSALNSNSNILLQGLLWAFSTIRSLKALSETPEWYQYTVGNITKTMPLEPALTPMPGYLPIHSHNLAIECALQGVLSLCLSIVNITCIFIMAFVLLKVCRLIIAIALSITFFKYL